MTTTRTYPAARAFAAFVVALSTLAFVFTGAAPASVSATPVPIVMYHVIGDPRGDVPFPELYVRAADFAAQMRWLERHGYQPVTLRAVWDHWQRGAPLPKRPIVISFDDGYRSHVHAAFPPMRERGWPGVLNLAVKNLRVAGGLSPRQVRRLIAAGWELDAHSVTHPDLTTLDDHELEREVAGSRRQLQRLFGVPVDFFCYPSGDYDARVIAAVRRAGFLAATTTLEGLATPGKPYELRRVRVSRSDGVAGFRGRARAPARLLILGARHDARKNASTASTRRWSPGAGRPSFRKISSAARASSSVWVGGMRMSTIAQSGLNRRRAFLSSSASEGCATTSKPPSVSTRARPSRRRKT